MPKTKKPYQKAKPQRKKIYHFFRPCQTVYRGVVKENEKTHMERKKTEKV